MTAFWQRSTRLAGQRSARLAWQRSAPLALCLALAVPFIADAATPEFRIAPPVTRKLSNGITVAVFKDTRLPLAEVELTFPAGSGADGSYPAGTAYVTSQMIGWATTSRDLVALHDELERAGGRLDSHIGRDMAVVNGTFLAAQLPLGIELVADAVKNALLTDDSFERSRAEATALTAGAQGAVRRLEQRLWHAEFGDGPYGHSSTGTAESLAELNLGHVRGFYSEHYGPSGAVLAVTGDVNPDAVFKAAEDAFSDWEVRPVATAPAVVPARRSFLLMPGNDPNRCDVWVGVRGPRAGDPDETAVALAIQCATRSARGLKGVTSGQSALKTSGLVWLAASAKPDSAAYAARRLEAALTSLATTPPDARELQSMQQLVRSTFPMRFEQPYGLIDQWSAEAALGLGFDEMASLPDRIEKVTPAAISAAAKKWFVPAHMTFVAAGASERSRPALAAVAPLTEEEAAEGPPTAAAEKRGRELVTKALEAHGGLTTLRKVKDSTLEASATMGEGEDAMQANIVQVREEPWHMIYDLRVEGTANRQVLSGDHGWTAPIDTLWRGRDADSASVASLRRGFTSDVVHVLLAAVEPGARTIARGTLRSNSGVYDKVELWTRGDSTRTLMFDPDSHLLAGVEVREFGRDDPQSATRRWYSDYRTVNGIRLPFAEERWVAGRRVMQLKVTRYDVNSGVPAALFERPEAPLPPPRR